MLYDSWIITCNWVCKSSVQYSFYCFTICYISCHICFVLFFILGLYCSVLILKTILMTRKAGWKYFNKYLWGQDKNNSGKLNSSSFGKKLPNYSRLCAKETHNVNWGREMRPSHTYAGGSLMSNLSKMNTFSCSTNGEHKETI